jgi:hypothetical protein
VRAAIAAVAVLAAAGCRAGRADDARPRAAAAAAAAPPPGQFEADMMRRFHMHESFDLLRAIEWLLIRGRLEPAQDLARLLAIGPDPDDPELAPWAAQITAVHERAHAVVEAPAVDEALRREAWVAAACADCHREMGELPVFAEPGAPPGDQPTLTARMARHRWATDRLWEGVIADADGAWKAGLEVLAATPLPWSELDGKRAILAQRLHDLATTNLAAAGVTDPGARARAYGELLVVCATCHVDGARR